MAQKILDQYADRLTAFELIPGRGGVFEFSIDDQLLFSKKSVGRFPEDEEIFQLIDSR
ncbi:MAG: Rdx family protein [Candidatus Marinimicrobia bacterium]|nr:Rdx family protein [Candidatus Neomarinimicrobiota bacterium]